MTCEHEGCDNVAVVAVSAARSWLGYATVCMFANHRVRIAWRNGAAYGWECTRCRLIRVPLPMTLAWLVGQCRDRVRR